MEINGLANINTIVQMAMMENTECHTSMSPEVADKINEQLQLLERYMLAYKEAAEDVLENDGFNLERYLEIQAPAWHEVKADPEKYPLLKERMNGVKQG